MKKYNIILKYEYFGWTLIWASLRAYLSKMIEGIEPEFIEKLLKRFGGLSSENWDKLVEDVKFHGDYAFGDVEYTKFINDILLKFKENTHSEYEEYPVLDDFEFKMLRLAIRYFCGRETIMSASFPNDIIKMWYEDLSDNMKEIIIKDLNEYLDYKEKHSGKRVFGNENYDNLHWQKFLKLLDKKEHYQVELIDDSIEWVVKYDDVVYPVKKLISSPGFNIFVPEESIKKIII
jgi:hypothetical protein